jgi:Tol biopolymer transport system component
MDQPQIPGEAPRPPCRPRVLPEAVLTAAETGMSIGEPRVSPDGRRLLFCMASCGSLFPFQSGSDLHLMEIASRKYQRPECNSQQSESWHSWSSNSRWIVFTSMRDVPLLSRLYFSYIDSKGNATKPFLLPQKDPSSYDLCLNVYYNVPELVSGPIAITQRELIQAVGSVNATADEPQKPRPAEAGAYPAN